MAGLDLADIAGARGLMRLAIRTVSRDQSGPVRAGARYLYAAGGQQFSESIKGGDHARWVSADIARACAGKWYGYPATGRIAHMHAYLYGAGGQ